MTPVGDNNFIKYKKDMELNFPFFRMFLADNVDAIIVHFISTGKASKLDLARIYDGMYEALLKLIEKYTTKTAKAVDDKIKLPRGKLGNSCDSLNHQVVFKLSQVLIHLLTETTLILSEINTDEH